MKAAIPKSSPQPPARSPNPATQPVKTYSSGMVLRLAFAVSIHVEPDILIVDEALAVGDIYFQNRCSKVLKQKLDDGLTLLVSHSPTSVRTLCRTGLVLDRGQRVFLGPSDEAVNIYHTLGDARRETAAPIRGRTPPHPGRRERWHPG